METKAVYKAISAVQGEMAVVGISKDRTNHQGSGYQFRGIDDVLNALAPILAKHKLVIMPRAIRREMTERTSKAGGALFYVTLEVEYDFISAVDGSMHTAKGIGEAMDSGDKGTNKAMSAAYKYVCFQAFCIPTEGDNDTDNHTHEVRAYKPSPARQETPKTPIKPKTYIGKIDDVTKGVSPTGKNFVCLVLDGEKCYIAKGSPEEAEGDCQMFGDLMDKGLKVKAEVVPAGAVFEITKIEEA